MTVAASSEETGGSATHETNLRDRSIVLAVLVIGGAVSLALGWVLPPIVLWAAAGVFLGTVAAAGVTDALAKKVMEVEANERRRRMNEAEELARHALDARHREWLATEAHDVIALGQLWREAEVIKRGPEGRQ